MIRSHLRVCFLSGAFLDEVEVFQSLELIHNVLTKPCPILETMLSKMYSISALTNVQYNNTRCGMCTFSSSALLLVRNDCRDVLTFLVLKLYASLSISNIRISIVCATLFPTGHMHALLIS